MSGDAHGLDDLRIIPISSILSNSAFEFVWREATGFGMNRGTRGSDEVLYSVFACLLSEIRGSDVRKLGGDGLSELEMESMGIDSAGGDCQRGRKCCCIETFPCPPEVS